MSAIQESSPHWTVVTSNAGLIATETQDANPEQVKVYDLVGTDWVEQ